MTETRKPPRIRFIKTFFYKIISGFICRVLRFYFTAGTGMACLAVSIIISPFPLKSQNKNYARTVIGELCSPKMYGRGYVLHGDSIAAAFVKNEFIRSGLVPINESYDQVFKIPVNVFPGEVTCIMNGDRLTPGKDFLISPSSPAIHGEFSVLNLTPGILLSRKMFLKFLRKSEQKAILINKNDFAGAPDSLRKGLDQLAIYLANEETFTPAVILIADTSKLTWSAATFTDQRPVIYVKKIPPGNLKKLFIRIDQQFIPAYHTRNVAGMIPAENNPDSFIVITAHYDHLGMMGEDTLFPGANDNASGTALMLDLARELASIRDSLDYSIIFLAFSGEELGLLGSQYFSEHPVIELSRIRFLINLDLAGTGDDGITVVNAAKFKPEFGLLEKINGEGNLLPAIKSRGEACNSDHCFLFRKGVPCFYIYTLGGITAYHDIYDRAETLPLTAYDNYFTLLRQFIIRYASLNRN